MSKMKFKKLKGVHKIFCREYVIDLNASRSYRVAFPGAGGADQSASRLLAHKPIQKFIKKLQKKKFKKLEISAERVIKELGLLAFSDTGDLFTEDGGLKHISAMPEHVTRTISEVTSRFEKPRDADSSEAAEIVKIKCYDKKGALEALGKHFGIFEKDNVQAAAITISTKF